MQNDNYFKRLFFRIPNEKENSKVIYFNIFVVLIFLSVILWYAFTKIPYEYSWERIISKYYHKFIIGFFLTLFISIFALILSLIFGTFLAMGSKSNFYPYYYFTKIYTELIRGTPLIVQIFLFYYVVGTAFRISNRYFMGVVIMSIFSSSYVGEIIRAGIESIEHYQIETAKSLGFTKFQIDKYIIFPQVVKRIMPPLAGQFGSLIKDSSLLSLIAVNEFTKNVQEVDSLTFSPIENYFILALGYLLLTYPISHFSKYLERRFSYED